MAVAFAPQTASTLRQFQRWGYDVTGWFSSPYELEEQPGVYVVATQGFHVPFVLDVGESDNVRFCVLNHERRTVWRRNALGNLLYACIYTQDLDSPFLSSFARQNVEQHIRSREQPMFGMRELFSRPHAAM